MTASDDSLSMADYLAGELSPEAMERFERRLAEDPTLAEEAAGLKHALSTLRSLPAEPRERRSDPPESQGRSRLGTIVLRYAAVIALAFLGGYLTARDGSAGGDAPVTTPLSTPEGGLSYEERFARAYVAGGDTGGFSQMLRAIRASNLEGRGTP